MISTAIAVETDSGYEILADDELLGRYSAVQRSPGLDKQLSEKTSIIKYKQ